LWNFTIRYKHHKWWQLSKTQNKPVPFYLPLRTKGGSNVLDCSLEMRKHKE
jgi:hypothetical protein